MGLFDQVVSALNNPEQAANTSELGNILSKVQEVAGESGLDTDATEKVMSALGGHLRSTLKNKKASEGVEKVEEVVNQHSGTNSSIEAVLALFTEEQQSQVAEAVASKTGVDSGMIKSMMPSLIPTALKTLQQGSGKSAGSNSVLNSFLDADGDGDVDLGDMLSQARKFSGQ